jgi:hypothetical protein
VQKHRVKAVSAADFIERLRLVGRKYETSSSRQSPLPLWGGRRPGEGPHPPLRGTLSRGERDIAGNSGWEGRLQNLSDRGDIVSGDPLAKLEYVRSKQRFRIGDVPDRMHFHVWWIAAEPDNESFHLSLSERNNDAATYFDRYVNAINKRSQKRQTHRDIDVHDEL